MSRESTWTMPIILSVLSLFGLCSAFFWGWFGQWLCWLLISMPLILMMYYLFIDARDLR